MWSHKNNNNVIEIGVDIYTFISLFNKALYLFRIKSIEPGTGAHPITGRDAVAWP